MFTEEDKRRADIPMGVGALGEQAERTDLCDKQLAEPSLAHRLEQKRNRLTRQLVQVEEALRLIYADPNAERIHEVLKRAGY